MKYTRTFRLCGALGKFDNLGKIGNINMLRDFNKKSWMNNLGFMEKLNCVGNFGNLDNFVKFNKSFLDMHSSIKQFATPPKLIEAFTAFEKFHLALNSAKWLPNLSRIANLAISLPGVFDQLETKTRKTIEVCILEGWYPISSMPLGFMPDKENFDRQFGRFIEESAVEIEDMLCEHYPHRAKIIKSAFSAYRRGEYELAIPTLFAQAEGICVEAFNVSPFSKKSGCRLKDVLPPSLLDGMSGLYFRPLIDIETIRANTANVAPSTLNRHYVLHGGSTEYGTKLNCLKLISFLASLDWLISSADNNQDEDDVQ